MIRFLTIFFFLISFYTAAQEEKSAFKKGEALKYRIHYGLVNAGYATLGIQEKENQYHFIGKGWTVGITNWFFKVRDQYESYVDKSDELPTHFVRNVNEGGYKINRDVYFNQPTKKARVEDHKRNTTKEFKIDNVQDLLSAFYKLRNSDIDTMKVGESIKMDLFIDNETFAFKLVLKGKETISSKFGKIPCYEFRPYVQSGRIFKEEESLTIWISADKNKIPVRIKASLAVGSLKIDLTRHEGLSHAFPENL